MRSLFLVGLLLITGPAFAQSKPRYEPIPDDIKQYNSCVMQETRATSQQTEAEREQAIHGCMLRNGWRKVAPK